MKKTNILVEVDDKVYDLVVAPHKKAKTFSKLMATLLKGYIENDYVRAYAEGTLDEMRKASVNALDDVLGSMQQSLSSLGLYTGELKNTNMSGMEKFSGMGNFENTPEESVVPKLLEQNTQMEDEVKELRSTVDDLKGQNSTIISLLEQLLGGAANLDKIKNEAGGVTLKNATQNETKPTLEVEDIITPSEDSGLVEIDVPAKDVDAKDVMSSLLVGNSFSF